ncbi:hypothetical protein DMN91_005127 [Ooceraea biroi]|uniref:Elongator complex protein 4 n=1 Tax=Ooceraea biroi TaxID=2015173 RepID=A0A026W511_OOCBI|nr:elongator complex protein 4 [Ooceraea biroi]EZA51157.1 Elongator complex protein [Ooceraea biroi]RLU22849.1 hypothetical protein DMN91_005127 [Ooceraea biroi]
MATARVKTKLPTIRGAKPSLRNAQLLISSGLPSLDNVIGGGLPIGSILLIEEDRFDVHAKIILKYFMAEGIVTSQPLLVASNDVETAQLVSELPAVTNDDAESDKRPEDKTDKEMKIAWRYQNMKMVDSSPEGGQTRGFGHYYDLSSTMQEDLIKTANIKHWHACYWPDQNHMFTNKAYYDLLRTIQRTLHEGQYFLSETPRERNILRIALHSLGSRLWLSDRDRSSNDDLVKFFYCFRTLLRNSYAVGVTTVPFYNFEHSTVIERLEHMSDIAIRLKSFADFPEETDPLFKDYHGVLQMKKLPALSSLAPHCPVHRDLVFKLRRKKFVIEILHLQPEFNDTAQREQDETTESISGCTSGSHNNLLDF